MLLALQAGATASAQSGAQTAPHAPPPAAPSTPSPTAPHAAHAPTAADKPAVDVSRVPAGWWPKGKPPSGWQVFDSPKHAYQVQSQLREEPSRALAGHMDAMLDLYARFWPHGSKAPEKLVVKLFARRDDFLAYGEIGERPAASAGKDAWFDPVSGDVVAYDTSVLLGVATLPVDLNIDPDRAVSLPYADVQRLLQLSEQVVRTWTPDTAGLIAREGWQQYLAATKLPDAPPPWLVAGLAGCFAAATSGSLGAPDLDRLRAVHRAGEDGSADSLSALLALTPAAFAAEPRHDTHDAQAWSFVAFLLDRSEPPLHDLPATLLRDWAASKQPEDAVRKDLAGIDLVALENDWLAWIRDHPAPDPLADLAREFGSRIKSTELQIEPHWREVYNWHRVRLAQAARPPR